MPAQDLIVQTPGSAPASIDHQPDGSDLAGIGDTSAARIAELEGTVAQQAALIGELNAKLQGLATVPSMPEGVQTGPRLIGEDWSTKTTAEAYAAGVTKTVLCSDGYFVP